MRRARCAEACAARSWTTEKKLGYSIMDCDLVCVPVHQEVHWVLAVIDIKRREVRYYDSLGGVDRSCMVRLWPGHGRVSPA
jgi:sentrin-specific protease 1